MIGSIVLAAALCGQQPGHCDVMVASAGALNSVGWAIRSAADERLHVVNPEAGPDADDKQSERERLIAKRRGKRAAAYTARTNREAAESQAMAKAQAKAEADYRAMLPYMLEARRQDMALQAAREQAAATRSIANSISRAAGYAQGVQQPVRVVNDPAGIYNAP